MGEIVKMAEAGEGSSILCGIKVFATRLGRRRTSNAYERAKKHIEMAP